MIEKKYVEIFYRKGCWREGRGTYIWTVGVTKLLEFHMIYRTKKEDENLKQSC